LIYAAGIDVGSTQTKGVILDGEKKVLAQALIPTGAHITRAAEKVYHLALEQTGLKAEEISYVVGTGYGRFKVTFGNTQVTEISCHARGAHYLFPKTRSVLDIGGQDSKAVRGGSEGEVVDFCMNDKCAAGTGRFLAAAARILDIPLDDLGAVTLKGEEPVHITTTCTVFVESELISFMAQGKKTEDILMGMHLAIASRCFNLLQKVGIEEELTFTGGVTKNIGMVRALEDVLEMKINVHPDSHFAGAIGAALFALEKAQNGGGN